MGYQWFYYPHYGWGWWYCPPETPTQLNWRFNMATATVEVFWNKSVSSDVVSQVLSVKVGDADVVENTLMAETELFVVDVPEKTNVSVTLKAFDGTNYSDAAALDFNVGDLVAPLAPTGLDFRITGVNA